MRSVLQSSLLLTFSFVESLDYLRPKMLSTVILYHDPQQYWLFCGPNLFALNTV